MNPVRTALWATAALGAAGTLVTLGVASAPFVLAYGRARRVIDNPPTVLALLMGGEQSHAAAAGIEPTLLRLLGGAKR